MTYISPVIQERFNTLPQELKDFILQRNVELYTLDDLMNELEEIVNEAEVTNH